MLAKKAPQPASSPKITPLKNNSSATYVSSGSTEAPRSLSDIIRAGGSQLELAKDIAQGAKNAGQNPNEVINSKTITNSGIFNKPAGPQITGSLNSFGGKVIQGDGAKSYEQLAGNQGDFHYNPQTGRHESANADMTNKAIQYGLPIGADGNINFDSANNEIRKMFGLPEMKTENGIRMYKDPITGQWVADPNAKAGTVTAPGVQQAPRSNENPYDRGIITNNGITTDTNSPESVLRSSVAENPGGFIPSTNSNLRGRSSLFGLNTQQPGVKASEVNKDVKETIGKGGSVPKVNKPGSVQAGGIKLGYEPGNKYDARGNDLVGQIQTFLKGSDSGTLNALADRIHFSAKGEGRGAAYIGGFGSEREANAAMAELQKSLDPELLGNLKISVDRNPANGKYQIQFRGDVIPAEVVSENKDEAPGGPIDNNIKSVEASNAFNQQLRDLVGQMIIQAQMNKGKTHGAAQDALGREIPGVGETSPEQEAEVQRQIQAFKDRGVEQIGRDFNTNVRGISADLLNRGFAGSNVVQPNLEEGAFRPADIGKRDLLRELVTQENAIRDSIANRQNAAVNTLNDINEPGFPTNVPGVTQLQQGTFTPKATFADAAELAKIFLVTIPGMDQQTALELAKSYIDANSETIASPGIGTQILTAGSNIAGAYLGGPKKP